MNLNWEIKNTPSHILAGKLAKEINHGYLKPGEKLNSLREIAEHYQVSLATVRNSFKLLSQASLIISQHGSGTFVNPALKLRETKLIGLITTFGRENIENYYDPLFAVAGEKQIIPMVSVIKGESNWKQAIKDIVARQPDALLIDVEARYFLLDELEQLCDGVPMCFCNRWEWYGFNPKRAILTDYVSAYIDALKYLKQARHQRIIIAGYHRKSQPFLEKYLKDAAKAVAMKFPSIELEYVSSAFSFAEIEQILSKDTDILPTAVFALSDSLLWSFMNKLHDLYPDMPETIEKIGFFDQHWSNIPGREFSSYRIDFGKIWKKALEKISDPQWTGTEYVTPIRIQK